MAQNRMWQRPGTVMPLELTKYNASSRSGHENDAGYLAASNCMKINFRSREVMGKFGSGTGFLVTSTAAIIHTGKTLIMKRSASAGELHYGSDHFKIDANLVKRPLHIGLALTILQSVFVHGFQKAANRA